MNIDTADLRILKGQLRGPNLKNLLFSKKITRYRVAKDCRLSYRTLYNWERKNQEPSDYNAILVGRYLGLIKSDKAEKLKALKELSELKKRIERLG
jgi:transcriptional regulator with XRE-family HTH domain